MIENAKRRLAWAGLCMMAAWAMVAFAADAPRKMSHSEALGAVVTKVAPAYPHMARQLRIEGVVELEAMIAENGDVEEVNIVSGNPMLTKPAVEALKKWKFKPFMVEGKAVKAAAPIGMIFKL